MHREEENRNRTFYEIFINNSFHFRRAGKRIIGDELRFIYTIYLIKVRASNPFNTYSFISFIFQTHKSTFDVLIGAFRDAVEVRYFIAIPKSPVPQ